VFAVATVLGALLDLKAIRLGLVAVSTARTARALVMDPQLLFTERALRFDH
jgi:hypothetical protein